jgi:L-lysine exporter family protein LysE/ArgO
VLRQGIRGDAALAVAFICTIVDVLLIAGAVAGADVFASASPAATRIATWTSAIFALAYGFLALATATRPTLHLVEIHPDLPAWPLSAAFALSFLNPQVYIEMLFLVGGASLQFAPLDRPVFGLGVALVSPLWFFGLACGGRRCARFFVRPLPRVMLDVASGVFMLGLATLIITRELGAG